MGLLAVARSITALGREHFLPPVSAWVHHKTKTPIITTAVLGVVTGEFRSNLVVNALHHSSAARSLCCSWDFPVAFQSIVTSPKQMPHMPQLYNTKSASRAFCTAAIIALLTAFDELLK